MKAIATKYIGPSSVRGSRCKASDGRNAVTMPWDSALDSSAMHAKAARALCDKMNWTGALIGGGFEDGSMVWVFEDSPDRA